MYLFLEIELKLLQFLLDSADIQLTNNNKKKSTETSPLEITEKLILGANLWPKRKKN